MSTCLAVMAALVAAHPGALSVTMEYRTQGGFVLIAEAKEAHALGFRPPSEATREKRTGQCTSGGRVMDYYGKSAKEGDSQQVIEDDLQWLQCTRVAPKCEAVLCRAVHGKDGSCGNR